MNIIADETDECFWNRKLRMHAVAPAGSIGREPSEIICRKKIEELVFIIGEPFGMAHLDEDLQIFRKREKICLQVLELFWREIIRQLQKARTEFIAESMNAFTKTRRQL